MRLSRARHRLYGIDAEKVKSLLEKQGGVCAICGDEPNSVDHDHETGVVRGVLCKRCNSGLGQFKDSVGFLLNAVAYLSATKDR